MARHNKSCEHKALQKVNVKRITKLLLYHNSAFWQFGPCPQFLVTELRQHQYKWRNRSNLGTTLTHQNSIQVEIKNKESECLLSLGAKSFVFQFAIQKYKD